MKKLLLLSLFLIGCFLDFTTYKVENLLEQYNKALEQKDWAKAYLINEEIIKVACEKADSETCKEVKKNLAFTRAGIRVLFDTNIIRKTNK